MAPIIFLVAIKGSSIGLAPRTVKAMKDAAIIILLFFASGLNLDLDFLFFFKDGTAMIKILISRAITPPILLGIDRRIA